MPADAVTSSATVSATVASAVSLTNNCINSPGWNFGALVPAQAALTATGASPDVCSFTFQSSNDTSMLRAYQSDQDGNAMTGNAGTFVQSSGAGAVGTDVAAIDVAPGTSQPTAKVYLGGRGGKLMYSGNSGSTWTLGTHSVDGTLAAAANGNVVGMAAVSATYSYAAQYNRDIARTRDGGANWSSICIGTCAGIGSTQAFYGIAAPSQSVVWAVASGGAIIKSANADSVVPGEPTWTLQTTVAGGMLAVAAVDATTAYATTASRLLLKTIDGGTTWVTLANAPSMYSRNISVVRNVGVDYVYSTGIDGNIVRSVMNAADVTPAAAAFTVYQLSTEAEGNRILGVSATDKDTVMFSGADGMVFRTTNGTATPPTFTRQTTGTDSTIFSISAEIGSAGAYFGTSTGTVGRTVDTGTTWTRVVPATISESADWHGVAATDTSNAYVVGTSVAGLASISRTTDSGATWTPVTTTNGLTTSLRSIAFADANKGVTVGIGGKVEYSANAAAGSPTWSPGTSAPTDDLLAVEMLPGTSTGWAVGRAGRIIKTTDGGANWSSQASGGVNLRGIAPVSATTVLVSGDDGTLLRTVDGGTSWQAITTGTTSDLSGVSAPDAQTFYVAMANTNIMKSTNADAMPIGSVSVVQQSASVVEVRAIVALSRNIVLSTGDSGHYQRTLDGGVAYDTSHSAPGDHDMWDMSAVNANTVWLVGDGNRLNWQVPGVAVPDYGGASTWGNAAPSTSLFGICLQQLTGANTAADFVEDTTNTPQNCQSSDLDPWNPLPTAAVKIAHTTVAGATGTTKLVYGFRTSSSQTPGTYSATITYEVVAPNV